MAKGNKNQKNVDQTAAQATATTTDVTTAPAPAAAQAQAATAADTKKGAGKKGAKGTAAATTTEAAPAATSSETATVAAPVESKKKSKKGTASASTAAAEAQPEAATTSTSEPAAQAAPKEKFVANLENFDALVARVEAMITAENERHKAVVAEYRQVIRDMGHYRTLLNNQAKHEAKMAAKKEARLAKSGGVKKTSGFMAKRDVSAEMLTFLGLPAGTQISINDMRNGVTKYAKEKNLQEGKKIKLDGSLKALFPTATADTVELHNIIGLCGDAGHYTKKDAQKTTA